MNVASGPAMQRQLSEYSQRVYDKDWAANHDGNLSVRLSDDTRFMATPTAHSKREIEAHHIITVDESGKVLSGRLRIFSEWHLHRACYRARPDVRAVIHAHPVASTAFGLSGSSLGVPAMPEILVSLGACIPTIPYAMPKSASQDAAIEKALTHMDADAFLIAGNGVVATGTSLEQAFLRLELVEHYAKILLAAQTLGGVSAMPAGDVDALLDKRAGAGLGKRGRSR